MTTDPDIPRRLSASYKLKMDIWKACVHKLLFNVRQISSVLICKYHFYPSLKDGNPGINRKRLQERRKKQGNTETEKAAQCSLHWVMALRGGTDWRTI